MALRVSWDSSDHSKRLPMPVTQAVVGYLPPKDLTTAAKVGKAWGNGNHWKLLYEQDFVSPDEQLDEQLQNDQETTAIFSERVREGKFEIGESERVPREMSIAMGGSGNFAFIRFERSVSICTVAINGDYQPLQDPFRNVAYCCFSSVGNFFVTTSGGQDIDIFELKEGVFKRIKEISIPAQNGDYITGMKFVGTCLFLKMGSGTCKVLNFQPKN